MYTPESCCWCVLKAAILAEFDGFLCADDVIFGLCHPLLSTDALINSVIQSVTSASCLYYELLNFQ